MKWCSGLMVLVIAAVLAGCGGGGIDENKPIEQVAAEAAKMGQDKLQSKVAEYESLISEKVAELDVVEAKLKKLSIGELTSDGAKSIKAEADVISSSLRKLNAQLAVYTKQLSAAAK